MWVRTSVLSTSIMTLPIIAIASRRAYFPTKPAYRIASIWPFWKNIPLLLSPLCLKIPEARATIDHPILCALSCTVAGFPTANFLFKFAMALPLQQTPIGEVLRSFAQSSAIILSPPLPSVFNCGVWWTTSISTTTNKRWSSKEDSGRRQYCFTGRLLDDQDKANSQQQDLRWRILGAVVFHYHLPSLANVSTALNEFQEHDHIQNNRQMTTAPFLRSFHVRHLVAIVRWINEDNSIVIGPCSRRHWEKKPSIPSSYDIQALICLSKIKGLPLNQSIILLLLLC